MSEDNNILILGNGFDLAHHLPTKYTDFMKIIEIINIIKKEDSSNISIKSITCNANNENIINALKEVKLLTNEEKINYNYEDFNQEFIDKIHKKIVNNIWIDYFLLQQQNNHDTWIDFESEISKVIRSLNKLLNNSKLVGEFYSDYSRFNNICAKHSLNIIEQIGFVPVLRNSTKNIVEKLTKDLINLIESLEIYLFEVVEKINIQNKLEDLKNIKFTHILSFNYTSTFKRIYDINKSCSYDYIHGKVQEYDKEKNNMVLGIDEYLDETQKNIDLKFIEFKKYFQRIYKKTGCNYKIWINKKNNYGINKLYIYGHSLDITDKDVLKEIILSKNIKNTTIFYLNDNDYKQKISNMVKLIGQDELTSRVYGKEPSIIFQEIKS